VVLVCSRSELELCQTENRCSLSAKSALIMADNTLHAPRREIGGLQNKGGGAKKILTGLQLPPSN